jgi:hypothetical protein
MIEDWYPWYSFSLDESIAVLLSSKTITRRKTLGKIPWGITTEFSCAGLVV